MKEYVVILAEKDMDALGRVRCWPQALAARCEGEVWLRGIFAQERLAKEIRQLPARQTYLLGTGELLFPEGGLTPVRTLPQLHWLPLTVFLPVDLPVSALPGEVSDRVSLKVLPSGRAEKGAAMLTGWPLWAAWVETAPRARLDRLLFAASASGQALVLGNILPAIPGREYWMRESILLPAGFDFEFPATWELIHKKFNPDNDAILLFDESGRMDKISRNHFVRATRSAVRLTQI
ncbi:MAG: hypothetical protein L6Q97_05925 [Thermoanaerobaculia bacterium]|nr:hypothetical protein [Thermoanaerobaculia bacterium]